MKTEEINVTKKNDVMLVDPRNIIIEDGFNVRKDMGNIEELMLQIVALGQLEPISGTKVRGEDKYILTDGHRRMKAIELARERGHDIPYVKLMPTSANIEDRIFAMVVTGMGKKALNVLEEGEAYKRLVGYSYTPKDISAKIGKSIAHVYNLLKLADAPKAVKNAIEKNEISGTTVMQIIREVKNPDELVTIVETAVSEAKRDNPTKKATVKNTSVQKFKTPLQKLSEAYDIAEKNKAANLELLFEVISTLNKKESTAKQVAKLFQ